MGEFGVSFLKGMLLPSDVLFLSFCCRCSGVDIQRLLLKKEIGDMNVLLNVDWGFTMAVVLTGIVVVFAALILLVFIIWLFGKIMTSVGRASSAPKTEKKKGREA